MYIKLDGDGTSREISSYFFFLASSRERKGQRRIYCKCFRKRISIKKVSHLFYLSLAYIHIYYARDERMSRRKIEVKSSELFHWFYIQLLIECLRFKSFGDDHRSS